MPTAWLDAAHDPIAAQALVYGVLLDGEEKRRGAEARVLRDSLSPAELLALIAVIGAGTGGGAFASRVGRSRSAPELSELKARVAEIETKKNA